MEKHSSVLGPEVGKKLKIEGKGVRTTKSSERGKVRKREKNCRKEAG